MTSQNEIIRIIPLGGFGEIGMNCLALWAGEQILVIDCGVLFPAEPRLGTDTIHASFEFLRQHQHKIVGLIATHGHEDHIAAIPFLLQEFNIPVFAGRYTNGLLRSRLFESNLLEHGHPIQMHDIFPDKAMRIGNFDITPLKMPHSTIDNFALIIDWNGTRIFHTSDFKLNMSQQREKEKLVAALRAIRPVDLMLTDSTGALESTDAGDEASLVENIGSLIDGAPGRVFVALFSSNIQRIRNLLKVAKNSNRKLVMSGKSVLNHYAVARETNSFAAAYDTVIPADKAHLFRDDELLILMSGTQGESRSALGRFAANRHGQFSARETDTVILSSRFIPGNELQISQTVSRLMALNVTVYHSNNRSDIHVSGHGSSNEIRTAIEAIAPAALLPAHGSYEHLQATARIGEEAGIDNIVIAMNGDVVALDNGLLRIETHVESGKVFIENGTPLHEDVLKERRKMSNSGLYALWVTVSNAVNPEKKCILRQLSMGVLSEADSKTAASEVDLIVDDVISRALAEGTDSDDALAHAIKIDVRRFIRNKYHRTPYYVVQIERLD